jgi:hypothetical protein
MSNIQVKLRRGTTTEHSSFAGAEGEVTVDTTLDTLMVHTGGGAGSGVRLAKHSELSAGGGGTVTSVGSGTGLTGGPITTSGTLSLASIANLRALGNVSGSTAAPTAVEIKDEDAMTSNSATALATQQSIKAYVDSQTVSKFDSLWVNQDNQASPTSLANNAALTFTHGLGTVPVCFRVFLASNSSGANPFQADGIWVDASNNNVYGCQATNITSNSITIQCSNFGVSKWTGGSITGTVKTFGGTDATHIRVIVIG